MSDANPVLFRFLPVFLALVAGALGIYWFQNDQRKAVTQPATVQMLPAAGGVSKALAKGPLAAFLVRPSPRPMSVPPTSATATNLRAWAGPSSESIR